VSRPRPFTFSPSDGQAMTLDDLSAFVAEAYSKGIPGTAQPHAAGVIEFDLANGPRILRLTIIPGQEATSDA
jgi:hypothetical protein